VLVACEGRRAAGSGSDPGAPDLQVMRARAVAAGLEAVPARTEALAIAELVEARAVREGAGARAAALHIVAAQVLERLWRIEGREADAKRAIDLYRLASRDVGDQGGCDAALGAARLTGEVSHDAASAYVELYRVKRRLQRTAPDASKAEPCRRAVDDALGLLSAFRPSPGALEAIDDRLAGEGVIADAVDSPGAPHVGPSQVVRVDSWPGRDAARVVIVLDRPAAYRVGDEVPPGGTVPATFLDFDGVALGAVPNEISARGIVTAIRAEPTSTGSRFWLDFEGRAWRRVFEMREPYRVVVDVARHPPGVQGAGPRTVARLVLDPGHGGSDRGAHGPSGVEEKDVALDIAHRVAPVLAAQGIEVVLTRDDDRYVSLEERTAHANEFGADLFVSIHCNASEGRARRGLETYVLDTSRDEIAARVAARENSTTQATSSDLAAILGGMRISEETRRARRLAQLLLRASTTAVQTTYGDAIDGGVHAAGFYVLVGARMPAVLFETSYISNAVEEQRLASASYRQLLADAIVNGVRAYREGR
jgi:N-acetylmuramoyl-L-alanine amidase